MLGVEEAHDPTPTINLMIAASEASRHRVSPAFFSAKSRHTVPETGKCSAAIGIMVRLKNRYLLVNMLYPELEKSQLKSDIPDIVVFNQPTTNELSPQALLRGIRAEVSSLFGDYGSGAVSESLSGKAEEKLWNVN